MNFIINADGVNDGKRLKLISVKIEALGLYDISYGHELFGAAIHHVVSHL